MGVAAEAAVGAAADPLAHPDVAAAEALGCAVGGCVLMKDHLRLPVMHVTVGKAPRGSNLRRDNK
jgi:hypothetical protein